MIKLIVLSLLIVVTYSKSVSKREVVDYNDPQALAEAIIGMLEGNIDYPKVDPHNLPEFNFRCEDQQYPGFYADTSLDCQVVHHCDQERQISGYHVCPNMTVFNQHQFTCMWSPTVDCTQAPQFYSLNGNLHVGPERDVQGNTVERYDPNRHDPQ